MSSPPKKTRQWTTAQDGLENLKLREVELPALREGEILVKIRAVSLNYRDTEVCMGLYDHHAALPADLDALVPCSDMAGTVVASRSPRWAVGSRVASVFHQDHQTGQIRESDLASGLGLPLPGVLAEYRVFPERGVVALPAYLTDEEASCLPIAGVTAWMSINGFRPLGEPLDCSSSSGEGPEEAKDEPTPSILVQGTGGVAMAGLQIAHAAGLGTIVTSSSDTKLDRAKKLLDGGGGGGGGSDKDNGNGTTKNSAKTTLINYATHWEWQGLVLDATGGRGADLILETGGARTLRKSFDCVAFGGTIACIGYVSGKGDYSEGGDKQDGGAGPSELNRLNVNVLALRRNVTLKGILNGPRDRFEEMLRFYEQKKIRPVVDKVFRFEEAKEAMQFLYKGEHFGKVVIRVAE